MWNYGLIPVDLVVFAFAAFSRKQMHLFVTSPLKFKLTD